MSLRQPTCLTPQRLDAARGNAQHSTGPRSRAGKQRMRMNALKHGCDAAPEHDAEVMRALGEDPIQYEAFKQDLATAYGPGDALWNHLLDELGRLSWQRRRLERMQTGQMRQDLEAVEERWRRLQQALASVSFAPCQCQAVAFDLPEPAHPCVRQRRLLSLLGVILEQVRRRFFCSQQRVRWGSYYKDALGWRPRLIGHWLLLFSNWAQRGQQPDPAECKQYVKEAFGDEEKMEARYQELLRLLEEQIAEEEAAFAEERAAQARNYEIEHDECLAPEGKIWEMLLKQEAALDRSIDRKVRMLLSMRKEHDRLGKGGARAAPTDESPDREAVGVGQRLKSKSAPPLDGAGSSADAPRGQGAVAYRTESPEEEDAEAETPKSPEQSENVVENKGSAAEEVAA